MTANVLIEASNESRHAEVVAHLPRLAPALWLAARRYNTFHVVICWGFHGSLVSASLRLGSIVVRRQLQLNCF
jgi:hypothetical protein